MANKPTLPVFGLAPPRTPRFGPARDAECAPVPTVRLVIPRTPQRQRPPRRPDTNQLPS